MENQKQQIEEFIQNQIHLLENTTDTLSSNPTSHLGHNHNQAPGSKYVPYTGEFAFDNKSKSEFIKFYLNLTHTFD